MTYSMITLLGDDHPVDVDQYHRDLLRFSRHLVGQIDQTELRDYVTWLVPDQRSVDEVCEAVATRGRDLIDLDRLEPCGRNLLAAVEHLHEPIACLLADDPLFQARYALALNPKTPVGILDKLAGDSDPVVCAAVAENAATDTATLRRLEAHDDQNVQDWAQWHLERRHR